MTEGYLGRGLDNSQRVSEVVRHDREQVVMGPQSPGKILRLAIDIVPLLGEGLDSEYQLGCPIA